MKLKSFLFGSFIAFFSSMLISSCMTMADYDFSKVDSNISNGKYSEAQTELQKYAKRIYSSKDNLLFLLDNGILDHFRNDTQSSNKNLSQAEQLIEKYSAISVMQNVGSYFQNDLVMDYAGEDYEDIYTNIFMSLNYIRQNNIQESMVEIRRFDNKLKLLKSKYEKQVKAANNNSSGVQVEVVSSQFSNSALARYLSMLLYRTDGDLGNAEVDLKYLKSAFETQPSLYNFSLPSTVDEEIAVPEGMGRLNILGFYGKAPTKYEVASRFYSAAGKIWYKIALPAMQKRGTAITSIQVAARNSETGEIYSKNLEKLESIENIALDTFNQHLSVITARTMVRTIAKAVNSASLDIAAAESDKKGEDDLSAIFSILSIFSKIHTEASERADTRSCRYFPANAAVSGLTLPPGKYDVIINFHSGAAIAKTVKRTVQVKSGRLNLIETECLK